MRLIPIRTIPASDYSVNRREDLTFMSFDNNRTPRIGLCLVVEYTLE